MHDEHYHKTNCDNPTEKSAKLPQTTYTTAKITSSNDDRTFTDISSSPPGQARRRDPSRPE